jgi:hypothetical protein
LTGIATLNPDTGWKPRQARVSGICLASYRNPPRPLVLVVVVVLGLLIAKKSTTKDDDDEDEDEKD